MLSAYLYSEYEYRRPAELQGGLVRRHPLGVVGAGPAGLALAIDLAQQGTPVLPLDDDNSVSVGWRGVCYAKRALQVLDRLGVGDCCVAKGVSWNVGRTFFREEEVDNFTLLAQPDHKRPGMINLQQHYLEEFLVRRAQELPGIDLRWKNRVVAVQQRAVVEDGSGDQDGGVVQIDTPDGPYAVACDWLIVADGARSSIRAMLKLEVEGKVLMDRLLIAEVVMKAELPAERWFGFYPPFHPGRSVLLHGQADNVGRIDFQPGRQAGPEEEKKPERVIPRIRAMLGDDRVFEVEWVSVYASQCRRMSSFRHRRVLLDSYAEERELAADENLLNSTRSTDFITPRSRMSLSFRNAVLTLARKYSFARALVNSGRLSVPAFLSESSLNTPDADLFAGQMHPGAPIDDAPVRVSGSDGWSLDSIGNHFMLLRAVDDPAAVEASTVATLCALTDGPIPLDVALLAPRSGVAPAGWRVFEDYRGCYADRYDARLRTVDLCRPGQHVSARWRSIDCDPVAAALARATCTVLEETAAWRH
ncbi:MAG TPA: FAD-dependent oxidoreductase [Candidatus Accumulibacter sp.]|nr:FAD-dependent oxidoreductase [Accumulibacter sp.]